MARHFYNFNSDKSHVHDELNAKRSEHVII